MKLFIGASSAFAAMLFWGPSAAKADWQYTKWGMTPAEVVAASGGAARLQRNEGADIQDTRALAAGHYSVGSIQFAVSYLFDGDDRLAKVSLNPQRPAEQCEPLIALTQKYYGPPISRSRPTMNLIFMEWEDRSHQNGVTLYYSVPGSCSLTYHQRAVSNATGGL